MFLSGDDVTSPSSGVSGSGGAQPRSGAVLPPVEASSISPYTLAASDNPGALITSVQNLKFDQPFRISLTLISCGPS